MNKLGNETNSILYNIHIHIFLTNHLPINLNYLYYIILLYYIYIILKYIILYYIILYFYVLYEIVLYYIILH